MPVIVFYLIFNDQNYFELEDAARGIVATGPIAAYIALVLVGARINKQISALTHPLTEAEEKLVGTKWTFESHSQKEDRTGSFEISDERGRLSIEGSFKKDGRDVGSWQSTMAQCESSQLKIVYNLSDAGKEQVRNSTGMVTLSRDANDPDAMSGPWAVIGDDTALGDMSCRRIPKNSHARTA